jgi:hypothetical protein
VDEENIKVIFMFQKMMEKMHLRTYLSSTCGQNHRRQMFVMIIYITILQTPPSLHVIKENTYVIYISHLGERITEAQPALTCLPA